MKITNKQVTKAVIGNYRAQVKLAKHKQDFQALLNKFIEDSRHELVMIDNSYHYEIRSVSIDTNYYGGIDIDIVWKEYKGDPDNLCVKDSYPSAEGIQYMLRKETKLHNLKVKFTSMLQYKWTPAEYSFWSDLGIIHHQTSPSSSYKTMSCSL